MAVSLNTFSSGSFLNAGFACVFLVSVVLSLAMPVEAQQPPRSPEAERAERERQMADYLRRGNPPLRPGSRGYSIGRPPVELSKEIKARLEISPEIKTEYAAFLKMRNTGVFKLLSDGSEADPLAIKSASSTQMMNPIFRATSTYSFREKQLGSWLLDIVYLEGQIRGMMATSHLIFTQLGVEDIASVTAETPGMPFLASLAQAKSPEEVDEIAARLAPGISDGGFRYTTSTWPRVGKIYGLRLVAYGFRRGNSFSPGEKDLLLAFKIATRDEDGSITVVWKELHRKNAPVFKLK